jgi:hypothetical protein
MIVPRLRLQEPQADGGELGGGERVCSARGLSRWRRASGSPLPQPAQTRP